MTYIYIFFFCLTRDVLSIFISHHMNNDNKSIFIVGMGRYYYVFILRVARYLGIESILVKYRDEILKLQLHLPTHIMEGRVKILETPQI